MYKIQNASGSGIYRGYYAKHITHILCVASVQLLVMCLMPPLSKNRRHK